MPVNQHQSTTSKSGNNYYNEYTTTTLYVELPFGFSANTVSFVNDSETDTVQISFDGATLKYDLKGAEYKDLSCGGRTSVHVKATTGGEKVRVSATWKK